MLEYIERLNSEEYYMYNLCKEKLCMLTHGCNKATYAYTRYIKQRMCTAADQAIRLSGLDEDK